MNKICKTLDYQEKREKKHISNIRNERGIITNDPMNIKMTIKKYYEKRCVHQFGNLDEMS